MMKKLMNNYSDFLKKGVKELQLQLSDVQINTLLEYVALLEKWNKHYNLSAIRSTPQIMTHHILDCLSIVPYMTSYRRVLDVGTGAGLPGIVLAICFPEHYFALLDSNGKKNRFLVQVKHDLKINNIDPLCARAENYRTDHFFDAIISRALGPINELIQNTQHLLCAKGAWCAMKGVYPELELNELALSYCVHPLTVPGLDASRHLVMVDNA